MRRPETRIRVLAFVEERIATTGYAPTLREIGDELGFSAVAAWKHVGSLVREGWLAKMPSRRLFHPGITNLAAVPTAELRAELRRRERAAAQRQDLAA